MEILQRCALLDLRAEQQWTHLKIRAQSSSGLENSDRKWRKHFTVLKEVNFQPGTP
jgi:hypothetical protein